MGTNKHDGSKNSLKTQQNEEGQSANYRKSPTEKVKINKQMQRAPCVPAPPSVSGAQQTQGCRPAKCCFCPAGPQQQSRPPPPSSSSSSSWLDAVVSKPFRKIHCKKYELPSASRPSDLPPHLTEQLGQSKQTFLYKSFKPTCDERQRSTSIRWT